MNLEHRIENLLIFTPYKAEEFDEHEDYRVQYIAPAGSPEVIKTTFRTTNVFYEEKDNYVILCGSLPKDEESKTYKIICNKTLPFSGNFLEGIKELVVSTHLTAAELKEGSTNNMWYLLPNMRVFDLVDDGYNSSVIDFFFRSDVTILKIISTTSEVVICEAEVDGFKIKCYIHCRAPFSLTFEPSMRVNANGYTVLLTSLDPDNIKAGGLYTMKHIHEGLRAVINETTVFIMKVLDMSENIVFAFCCFDDDAWADNPYYLVYIICNVR